jgi:hypothetical protein
MMLDLLFTDITPTISLLELIWTVPALFAWVRYAQRAWHAFWELRRLRQLHPPARLSKRLREKIRTERFLFLSFASECMALVGIGAMFQPPTPAQVTSSPIALIGPLLLVCTQWAIILKGELIERDEQALMWLYDREAEAAHAAARREGRSPSDVRGYGQHGLP